MYIKTAMRSALLLVLVVEATTAAPRRPGATPPLGWSTWCTGGSCGQPVQEPAWRDDHDVCTEAEIKSIATEMQSNGMRAAGYEYIMLVRLPAPAAPPPPCARTLLLPRCVRAAVGLTSTLALPSSGRLLGGDEAQCWRPARRR